MDIPRPCWASKVVKWKTSLGQLTAQITNKVPLVLRTVVMTIFQPPELKLLVLGYRPD